jgi:hypothetical protein
LAKKCQNLPKSAEMCRKMPGNYAQART